MTDTITVALLVIGLVLPCLWYRGYRRHLTDAQNSGFKYIVCPFSFQSILWIILQEPLLPLLSRLPHAWVGSWLQSSLFYRVWHFAHEPFARINDDTYMTTSSSGNTLWTCDPNVIDQILNRRHDFTKPFSLVSLANVYGPTITASEGDEHLLYRKIATTSIDESVHAAAWNETLRQAGEMAAYWTRSRGEVTRINADTSRLALNVVNKVFFDQNGYWTDDRLPPPGHRLTYNQASTSLFVHSNTLFLWPQAILKISPFKLHMTAKLAYDEMKLYMEDMMAETEQRLLKSPTKSSEKEGYSGKHGSLRENFIKAGMPEFNPNPATRLSADAILGNFFIFTYASLETSANTLAAAFVLLACRPEFQHAMQADIDSIFSLTDSEKQNGARVMNTMKDKYMSSFNRIWNGHVGALMQEVLRLWNVVMFIPKTNLQTQNITTADGVQHTVAANTLIMVNVAATHRNPNYWPTPAAAVPHDNEASRSTPNDEEHCLLQTKNSLSEFQPERWLAESSSSRSKYDPPRGAYVPFSDGFRACRGSRLARVEFCAAIARLFAEWTVELVNSSPEGLRAAEESMADGMKFKMSLFMSKPVPLRFVRRTSSLEKGAA